MSELRLPLPLHLDLGELDRVALRRLFTACVSTSRAARPATRPSSPPRWASADRGSANLGTCSRWHRHQESLLHMEVEVGRRYPLAERDLRGIARKLDWREQRVLCAELKARHDPERT